MTNAEILLDTGKPHTHYFGDQDDYDNGSVSRCACGTVAIRDKEFDNGMWEGWRGFYMWPFDRQARKAVKAYEKRDKT